MILTKQVNKDNFYKTYYTALNGILNLTNKQIDILSEFSIIRDELPDTFTDAQKDEYTFSSSTRGIICEKLNITIFNLNNVLKELRDKGFIKTISKKEYQINPFLFKRRENTDIVFKFNLT